MEASSTAVDNAVYETLGERWYTAYDDPVALLRAESKLRNPWVRERLELELGRGPLRILDVGCGGGFLSNYLSERGHHVTGVDLSEGSLRVARLHDKTSRVNYLQANAEVLPFAAEFDAVCAMDFLEHVEDPGRAILEIGRVLKPGGLFFFHTFNRNWISALVVIKAVEWFVRNTPPNLHVYRLFIKPSELGNHCARAGVEVVEIKGLKPRLFERGVLRSFLARTVPEDFSFEFCSSLTTAYCGYGRKRTAAGCSARPA